MRYNRFEDLPVWNSAIELAVHVYDLTERIQFRRRRSLRDQLERAAYLSQTILRKDLSAAPTMNYCRFSTLHAAQPAKSVRCCV